jgi:hypothetical protein
MPPPVANAPPVRLRPVSQVAPRPLDWLVPGLLALGKLTLFEGDPGLSKSLVALDLCVRVSEGDNALRPGIAAVSARLENGALRVLEGRCPNLPAEAGLYRYGDDAGERRAEVPADEHNHALAALRYLLSPLDAGRMVRRSGAGADAARRAAAAPGGPGRPPPTPP